jgi:hypothetical protein
MGGCLILSFGFSSKQLVTAIRRINILKYLITY